jgi:ribosome-associated translation inhibitor RaiA
MPTVRSDELQERRVNPNYTVEAVVARLEGVLVREYEKGGTAATIKAALDRAIDQLHRETGKHRERAQIAVVKVLEEGKKLTEGIAGKKDEKNSSSLK